MKMRCIFALLIISLNKMKQAKPNTKLSRLILLAILLITTTTVFAQNRGSVKGRVVTSTGQPAENVTIALQ